MSGGPPEFTLQRGARVLLRARGADPIEAHPKYNNFYYSTGEAAAQPGPHP